MVRKKLISLFERKGSTELSVICGIGRWRKPTRQPSGLIPIRQNEPRKDESMVKNGPSRKFEIPNIEFHDTSKPYSINFLNRVERECYVFVQRTTFETTVH
jgi:hypothetical protein